LVIIKSSLHDYSSYTAMSDDTEDTTLSSCEHSVPFTPETMLDQELTSLRQQYAFLSSEEGILSKPVGDILKENEGPHKSKGLQKKIYGPCIASNVKGFRSAEGVSTVEGSRRMSVGEKESGAFLFAFPYKSTYMQPKLFQIACQYRLGLDLPIICGDSLRCNCKHRCVIDAKGYHFNSCKIGDEINTRHNQLVYTIQKLVHKAGIKVKVEPKACFFASTDTLIRPDLRISNPGPLVGVNNNNSDVIVDVRVCDPLCSSHVNSDAIAKAETEKERKYQAHADVANVCFIPAVFESFGKMNKRTKTLVKALVKRIYEQDP